VPDGPGRMPVTAEVAALQREVSGNQNLVAPGWVKDGTIVADS